jgi:hypothetical protein
MLGTPIGRVVLKRRLVDENKRLEGAGGEEFGIAPDNTLTSKLESCISCRVRKPTYHNIAAPKLVPMADISPWLKPE